MNIKITESALLSLIESAQHGDSAAFDRLWSLYAPELEKIARMEIGKHLNRHTGVEDIVQTVAACALEGIAAFQPRPTDKSLGFLPWLKEILKNRIRDVSRRSEVKRRAGSNTRSTSEGAMHGVNAAPALSTTPSKRAAGATSLESTRMAMKTLSARQRDVIMLKLVNDATDEQGAAELKISPYAYQNVYRKAKKQLEDILGSLDKLTIRGLSSDCDPKGRAAKKKRKGKKTRKGKKADSD